MEPITQFVQILQSLQSQENDIRKPAENTYEAVSAPEKAQLLLTVSKTLAVDTETRAFALILLRRLVTNSYEEIQAGLSPEIMQRFRAELLSGLQECADVRRRFTELVAEVARCSLDEDENQQWPEVLKFMFESANSDNEDFKEASLRIFESCPGIFGSQQATYLSVIKEMLAQSLTHRGKLEIRTAAVVATAAFMVENEDNSALVKNFTDLVPALLSVCKENLDNSTGGLLTEDNTMDSLIELTTNLPKFLRPQLHDLITLCVAVLDSQVHDEETKHLALEAIVSFAESAAPAIRKEGKAYIPKLVEKCLEMMVELEEEESWHMRETDDDEDNTSSAAIGEMSLDRLCIALGAKTMIQPCFDNIQKLIVSSDWRHRYAGLMAISAMGEGCHAMMESILPKVVETVLPYLRDPNLRVRYAACNAIGQLSTDFSPTLQKRHHKAVLNTLLTAIEENDEIPRVQAHSAAALVNFCEECPKKTLEPYLQPIMERLEWVLQNKFRMLSEGKKMVLEQVITTIASVADVSEETFLPYYDRIMPCLKYILENATAPELTGLLGKTIECVSLVGLAVGPDKFKPDSQPIMEVLLRNHKASLTESAEEGEQTEDPNASYMISAWTRICKLMGPSFQQYLPVVMPAVLKAASHKPDVALLENQEVKDLAAEEWEFVSVDGQQNFGIRTAGLEDKATACQMLVCYAKELKEAFVPFVEEVTKLMVPMLKFYFHDEVRTAASECMPHLLECAKFKGDEFLRQMWAFIVPELLKAIENDPIPDAVSEHMEAMGQCIEVLGAGCFTPEQDQDMIRILLKHFEKYFENLETRTEKRKGEDYDEEVEKQLIEEDEEDEFVLSKATDITHAMFGTHGPAFLPSFQHLMPSVQKLLMPGRPLQDLQWGLCMVDDILEYAPNESIQIAEMFLEPMARGLNSESPEVRQAAAYGFGLMGQSGLYRKQCEEALPVLAQLVEAPDSRDTAKQVSATENAISAVAKIVKHDLALNNRDAILTHWLTWLPTWEDGEESEHIYGFLADIIESNHHAAVDTNLPKTIGLIAEGQMKGAYEECPVARARLANILHVIQKNEQVSRELMSLLTPDQIQAIEALLSQVTVQ